MAPLGEAAGDGLWTEGLGAAQRHLRDCGLMDLGIISLWSRVSFGHPLTRSTEGGVSLRSAVTFALTLTRPTGGGIRFWRGVRFGIMWTGDCGLRAWKTHESNLHYLKGINITAARGGRLGVWPYNPDFQDFLDLFAVFGPRRCLKSFLEAVRFISTHREPVASHGDPFRAPGHSTFLQVAVPRIRDSENLRI